MELLKLCYELNGKQVFGNKLHLLSILFYFIQLNISLRLQHRFEPNLLVFVAQNGRSKDDKQYDPRALKMK